MKRTDLEKETIANVSAMLDMSANEVEEVLGMSFANDPVDVITVFEVLHGLIVEHAKVEGALIKIHQQFVLKRTESKIKKAENRLAQQINHKQQGIGKRTTVTNRKEQCKEAAAAVVVVLVSVVVVEVEAEAMDTIEIETNPPHQQINPLHSLHSMVETLVLFHHLLLI